MGPTCLSTVPNRPHLPQYLIHTIRKLSAIIIFITRSCVHYMQNSKTVYQTQRSSTLQMALPTSELVKARRLGHHRLAVAGLRESEISIGTTRGDSTDDDHHRCRTTMAIVRAL